MSEFLSFRFLIFVFFTWVGLELTSSIHYLFLRYIKKDKNIEGVKFELLDRWLDKYFINKFSKG